MTKNRKLFLGKKIKASRYGKKKALQNMPRLRIFDQILNQEPKIVNLNQKSDFAFLYPRKVKKSIKILCFLENG